MMTMTRSVTIATACPVIGADPPRSTTRYVAALHRMGPDTAENRPTMPYSP